MRGNARRGRVGDWRIRFTRHPDQQLVLIERGVFCV